MSTVEEIKKSIEDRNIKKVRRGICALDRLSEEDEKSLTEALKEWEEKLKKESLIEVGRLLRQVQYAIGDLRRAPR